MKVLFVDDEEIIVEPIILMASLQNEYELFTSKNGNEALEFLDSNDDIDIVITDINMPFMNGIELMKNIKANKPHLKVIAMTGDDISKYEKTDVWFDDVKFKPFSQINELIKAYS